MKYEELNKKLQQFFVAFTKRKKYLDRWKIDENGSDIKDSSGNSVRNPEYDEIKYQAEMSKDGFSINNRQVSKSPLAYIFGLILSEFNLTFTEEWNVRESEKQENRKFYYDFFVHRLQLLIELDGKNYHHFPGKCKFCGKRNSDAQVLDFMRKQYQKERFATIAGYKLMRFFSDEVYDHGKMSPIPTLDSAALPMIGGEILDLVGTTLAYSDVKRRIINSIEEYSEKGI